MLYLIIGNQVSFMDNGLSCDNDGTSIWLVEGEQEAKKSAQDWWDKKLVPKEEDDDDTEVYLNIKIFPAINGLSFNHDGTTQAKSIFELESDRMNNT
jgi:hypothetical protein